MQNILWETLKLNKAINLGVNHVYKYLTYELSFGIKIEDIDDFR